MEEHQGLHFLLESIGRKPIIICTYKHFTAIKYGMREQKVKCVKSKGKCKHDILCKGFAPENCFI